MPQNNMRVAAPTDPDPKWPAGYLAALRDAGAKEKTIPFYIGWARRFFARFPGRRRKDLGRTEIEMFLSEVAAGPGASNWLIQQARDALELYYEKFRGIPLQPRASVSVNHTQAPVIHAPPPRAAPQASATRPTVGIQNKNIQYSKPVENVKAGTGKQKSEVGGRRSEDGCRDGENAQR